MERIEVLLLAGLIVLLSVGVALSRIRTGRFGLWTRALVGVGLGLAAATVVLAPRADFVPDSFEPWLRPTIAVGLTTFLAGVSMLRLARR